MEPITILIADDHRLVREIWTQFLESHRKFKVIASCGDAEQAVTLAIKLKPDIILMDIRMEPFSGIEATKKILAKSSSLKILGVSLYSKPEYAKRILQNGGWGYLTKNSSKEELIKAITEVQNGNKYICSEIKDIIMESVLENVKRSPGIESLTERELEVINLLKTGASSKSISQALLISLKTVEMHRHNILKKLKLPNVAALVNFINNSSPIVI